MQSPSVFGSTGAAVGLCPTGNAHTWLWMEPEQSPIPLACLLQGMEELCVKCTFPWC